MPTREIVQNGSDLQSTPADTVVGSLRPAQQMECRDTLESESAARRPGLIVFERADGLLGAGQSGVCSYALRAPETVVDALSYHTSVSRLDRGM